MSDFSELRRHINHFGLVFGHIIAIVSAGVGWQPGVVIGFSQMTVSAVLLLSSRRGDA